MSALDSVAAPLAEQLLRQFGKSATLRRTTTTFDPATGGASTSVRNFKISCFPERVSTRLIDGTNIRLGDLQIMMSGVGVVPSAATSLPNASTSDAVVIDNVPYPVYSVAPVYSGDKVAIFTVYARR
jgi:hypothetical protein